MLYKVVPRCTVLYRVVQVCTELLRVVQSCTALYKVVQRCTELCSILQRYSFSVLYRVVPSCTVLESLGPHIAQLRWGAMCQVVPLELKLCPVWMIQEEVGCLGQFPTIQRA